MDQLIAAHLLLGLWWSMVAGDQRFMLQPRPTSVAVGANVTLECRVAGQQGTVQWSKNGFAMGTERSLPEYDRYRMTGSSAEGDFNLAISDVQLNDEGNYQCQIGQTEDAEGRLSDIVHLAVLVPPSAPVIVNYGDVITTELGRNYSIVCKSDGGRPAPRVEWVVSKDVEGTDVVRKVTSAESTKTPTGKHGQMFAVKSVLNYTPHKKDNDNYLVCLVEHPALGPQMLETAAQLRVQYKPEIAVKLLSPDSSDEMPREKGAASLGCQVLDASPSSQLKYSWKMAGVEVGRSEKLFLNNLSKDAHHNKEFVCEVANDVGSTNASHLMVIEYGPRVDRVSPSVIRVNEGQAAVMQCRVDSSPATEVLWRREDSDDILHRGERFRIPQASSDAAGRYSCRAEIAGFSPAKQSFDVFINGALSVSMISKMEAAQGETVQLWCRVKGEPQPSNSVFWYKRYSCEDNGEWTPLKDTLTDDAKQRYKFARAQQAEGSHDRVLHIMNLLRGDFGCYNCTVNNGFGSRSASIELAEGEFLPLYYVIPLGIASAVVVLALCTAALCFNRRSIFRSTKSSNPCDDRDSDVVVKCESLDGSGVPLHRYYPDMYATAEPDIPEYAAKDYMPLPVNEQCDFDNLPPPYPSASYYSTNQSPPTSFLGNGSLTNGHLVHMTYLDDSSPQAVVCPLLPSNGDGDYALHNNPSVLSPQPIYSANRYSNAQQIQQEDCPSASAFQFHPTTQTGLNNYHSDTSQSGDFYGNNLAQQQRQNHDYPPPSSLPLMRDPVRNDNVPFSFGDPSATAVGTYNNGDSYKYSPVRQHPGASPLLNRSNGGNAFSQPGGYAHPEMVNGNGSSCFDSTNGLMLSPPPVSSVPLETLHEVPTPETEYNSTEMRIDSQQSTHV